MTEKRHNLALKKASSDDFLISDEEKKLYLEKTSHGVLRGKKAALVTHRSPDVDAIGLANAIRCELALRGINADIFGGNALDSQITTVVNRLNIPLQDDFEGKYGEYGCVILCDTGITYAAFPDIEPGIIIDHHRLDEKLPDGCLLINRSVGSASTIGFSLIRKLKQEVTADVAIALAAGINIDTNYLESEGTTEYDHEANRLLLSQILSEGKWQEFIRICMKYDITKTYLELVGRAYTNIFYSGYLAVAGLGETSGGNDNDYGRINDTIFRLPEIRLAVVIGIKEGRYLKSSVRTDLDSIQIKHFCNEIFGAEADVKMGTRLGAGGALMPLSGREIEEWEVAKENGSQNIIFGLKLTLFQNRILRYIVNR